jgi:phospholipid/cholesterol/gamma-HCH transport system permease protein
MARGWLCGARQGECLLIEAGGAWTLDGLRDLHATRQSVLSAAAADAPARIDVSALDTVGAWLLHQLERNLGGLGWRVELNGLRARHAALLAEIRRLVPGAPPAAPRVNPILRLVARLGRGTLHAGAEVLRLLSFYGQTALTLARVLLQPRRRRPAAFAHHLEQACVNALPIVGLIAFLIGIVMAYQGADQLRRFGAEIYTVDLLGISILREIGILLTAIVIAGRSGSAFTAQIGTMKVDQEVDALCTIGLDPLEVLVLPRLLAPMLALPLLVFFADVLALAGGALMCALSLGIAPGPFAAQLGGAITLQTFFGRPRQSAGVRLRGRYGRLLPGPERERQRGERRPAHHPLGGARDLPGDRCSTRCSRSCSRISARDGHELPAGHPHPWTAHQVRRPADPRRPRPRDPPRRDLRHRRRLGTANRSSCARSSA